MNIYNFLKSGTILNLRPGMHEDELIKTLGKKALGRRLYHHPSERSYYSYYYGDYMEFMVHEKKIIAIKIHIANAYDLYASCDEGVKCDLYPGPDLPDFLPVLTALHIGWQFYSSYCFNQQIVLLTEGGVSLIFVFRKDSQRLELDMIGIYYEMLLNDRYVWP